MSPEWLNGRQKASGLTDHLAWEMKLFSNSRGSSFLWSQNPSRHQGAPQRLLQKHFAFLSGCLEAHIHFAWVQKALLRSALHLGNKWHIITWQSARLGQLTVSWRRPRTDGRVWDTRETRERTEMITDSMSPCFHFTVHPQLEEFLLLWASGDQLDLQKLLTLQV